MPQKPSYLFVSPHLDDAILSCGGLFSYLAPKTDVTIATVFTEAHNSPTSLSIRRFLKNSGYDDSEKLFIERRREDKIINDLIGVKTIHLRFTDGLYRLKSNANRLELALGNILQEAKFIYPLFAWQLKMGKVSSNDGQLINEITRKIEGLVGPKTVLFAPVATGSHLDHKIVRRAIEGRFENVIFWSDFPYNVWDNQFSSDLGSRGYQRWEWNNNLDEKIKLIRMIKTQVSLLFPDGNIPKVPEYYFAKEGVVPFPATVGGLKPLAKEDQYSESQEGDQRL